MVDVTPPPSPPVLRQQQQRQPLLGKKKDIRPQKKSSMKYLLMMMKTILAGGGRSGLFVLLTTGLFLQLFYTFRLSHRVVKVLDEQQQQGKLLRGGRHHPAILIEDGPAAAAAPNNKTVAQEEEARQESAPTKTPHKSPLLVGPRSHLPPRRPNATAETITLPEKTTTTTRATVNNKNSTETAINRSSSSVSDSVAKNATTRDVVKNSSMMVMSKLLSSQTTIDATFTPTSNSSVHSSNEHPPFTVAPVVWKDDIPRWAARDPTNASLPVQPYPRWGGGNNNHGINLDHLALFIHGLVDNTSTVIKWKTQRAMFPETPYIVNGDGLFVSKTIRKRTAERFLGARVAPTEYVASLAVHLLTEPGLVTKLRREMMAVLPRTGTNATNVTEAQPQLPEETADPYARLRRAVLNESGFPYISWYGDFQSCNHFNWIHRLSIPLFTTCASTTCQYTIPFPTYKTILDSKPNQADWKLRLDNFTQQYGQLKDKIPKVVWRGSLTGLYQPESPRARLGRFAQAHRNNSMLDMGLTGVPVRRQKTEFNVTELFGGLVPKIKPMSAFQQYLAILDIDGNSWSSRFGTLLCYNSVIVKVEPHWVDYFHFKYLQPWKHYVPVKYDLSNLLEIAEYVTNPRHLPLMQQIVKNANQYCRTHMVHSAIALDMLDIWQDYIGFLDLADPQWPRTWIPIAEQFLHPNNTLRMTKVPYNEW